MRKWEISSLQAGMLVAGIVALTGHALAVSQFIRAGGRDAWLSGIFALPMAAVAVWSWYKLTLIFPGQTVVQYLPRVLGPLGYPIAALFPIYYFTVVVFTIRMTTDWMVDTILPDTPSWVMGLLYMAAVVYPTLGGLDVLARINQFTLPLLTGLGILVSLATMQAKDYGLLLPLFENGPAPLVATTFLGMGYYGETSIVGMYNAWVGKSDRPKLLKAYLLALVFVVTTLTGPLAGSVATMGYRTAENMPYPTFQHWLMVSFARFFERTDLLAVHQWLAGAYVRCAIYLLMAVTGCCQLVNKPQAKLTYLVPGAALLVVVLSELAFGTKPIFDEFVTYVYLPAGAYLGIFLPPLLLLVAWARGLSRKGQGAQSHGA